MPRVRCRLFILLILPFVASCNLLVPFVFVAKHTKTVSPEFDKLPGKTVVVMVWTDPSTLFDYPHARLELATYVADKLSVEMRRRELEARPSGSETTVVNPRDVEDYMQRNVSAQTDPNAVGRALNADYVIFLEIVRFQMRDRDHPQFLRGKIDASVSVHDIRADSDQLRRYALMPVSCLYPDVGPVPLTAVNSPIIREGVYRIFGEIVARKFYEYTIDMYDGS